MLKNIKSVGKNVCKRLTKTLLTFAMNPTIIIAHESYVGCQILTRILMSASKVFCSAGYVTNPNQ